MKKRRFLLILIPLVIACGCLLACIKYARMKQEMVDKGFRLIVKIEQYQKEHKRLPNNLRPLDIKMLPSGTHVFEGRNFAIAEQARICSNWNSTWASKR